MHYSVKGPIAFFWVSEFHNPKEIKRELDFHFFKVLLICHEKYNIIVKITLSHLIKLKLIPEYRLMPDPFSIPRYTPNMLHTIHTVLQYFFDDALTCWMVHQQGFPTLMGIFRSPGSLCERVVLKLMKWTFNSRIKQPFLSDKAMSSSHCAGALHNTELWNYRATHPGLKFIVPGR